MSFLSEYVDSVFQLTPEEIEQLRKLREGGRGGGERSPSDAPVRQINGDWFVVDESGRAISGAYDTKAEAQGAWFYGDVRPAGSGAKPTPTPSGGPKPTRNEAGRLYHGGHIDRQQLVDWFGEAAATAIINEPLTKADQQAVANLKANPPSPTPTPQPTATPSRRRAGGISMAEAAERGRLPAQERPRGVPMAEAAERGILPAQEGARVSAEIAARREAEGGRGGGGSAGGGSGGAAATSGVEYDFTHDEFGNPIIVHPGGVYRLPPGTQEDSPLVDYAIRALKAGIDPRPPAGSRIDLESRGALQGPRGRFVLNGTQYLPSDLTAIEDAVSGDWFLVDQGGQEVAGPFPTQALANAARALPSSGPAIVDPTNRSPAARAALTSVRPRLDDPLFQTATLDEMAVAGGLSGLQPQDILATLDTPLGPLDALAGRNIPEGGGLGSIRSATGNLLSFTGQTPEASVGVGSVAQSGIHPLMRGAVSRLPASVLLDMTPEQLLAAEQSLQAMRAMGLEPDFGVNPPGRQPVGAEIDPITGKSSKVRLGNELTDELAMLDDFIKTNRLTFFPDPVGMARGGRMVTDEPAEVRGLRTGSRMAVVSPNERLTVTPLGSATEQRQNAAMERGLTRLRPQIDRDPHPYSGTIPTSPARRASTSGSGGISGAQLRRNIGYFLNSRDPLLANFDMERNPEGFWALAEQIWNERYPGVPFPRHQIMRTVRPIQPAGPTVASFLAQGLNAGPGDNFGSFTGRPLAGEMSEQALTAPPPSEPTPLQAIMQRYYRQPTGFAQGGTMDVKPLTKVRPNLEALKPSTSPALLNLFANSGRRVRFTAPIA